MCGNIDCLVNRAGLAMSTIDFINIYYTKPVNFLDVSFSAEVDQQVKAIKLLNNDSEVDAIYNNISAVY